MKPLELEIQGLYSYREKQRLDFRPFHRLRLFGIFGKTGDGKSSILDAMTFALYGRVDRLGGRSLREAVNPAAGQLLVNFSFELDGAVFRVSRRFDPRGGTKAVLYRQEGGRWLPLAEKTREVEDHLERILGLRFEEFTKVVILPQGKFAEFLRLTPSRRAEMLEKLFDLEIYGDVLFQKVSRHLEALRATLEEKKSRLRALEDIYQELLVEKEREKGLLQEEIESKDAARKTLRQRLEQLKQLASWLKEIEDLKAQEAKLLAQEGEIEEIKRRLLQDQRLSPLRPIFEEFQNLAVEVPRQRKELKVLLDQEKEKAKELKRLQEALEGFRRQKETLWRELAEQEAEVRTKAAILEGLKKREESLGRLQKEKKGLEKRLFRLCEQLTQKKDEVSFLEREIKKAEERQKELSLSPKEKALLARLEALRPDFSLLQEKERRLRRLEDEYRQTLERRQELLLNLTDFWQKTFSSPLPPLEELSLTMERLLEEVENRLEQVSAACRRYERLHQAAVLAVELRPGEPCPVCGSREHPHPLDATEVKLSYQKLVAEEEELKEEKKRLKGAFLRFKPLLSAWEKLEAELKRRKEELLALQKEAKDLATRLKEEVPEVPLEAFLERYQCLLDRKQEILSLLEVLEKKRRQKEGLSEEFRSLEQEVARLESETGQLAARLEEEKKTIEEERREVLKQLGDRLPEEILREIEAQRKELEKKEDEWRKQERALNEELSRLRARLAEVGGLLREKEDRLRKFEASLLEALHKEGLSAVEELASLFLSEERRKEWEERVKAWEKALSGVRKRKKDLEAELERFPLKDLPPEEPEATERALNELEETLAALQERKGRLEAEWRRLKRDLEEKKTLLAQTKKLDQEILLADQLRQQLRGRALVTFAARQLFGEILEVANGLLRDLLGERFLIRMARETFSFSVYDLRLGHERPVETLSGGETFLVSFALALALSAYIQRVRARPIHFFFIDEGFGSLDEDLLEAVSQVLEELRSQDRLVGIITHLERFKQLLPAHVLVKKDSTGASRLQVKVPGLV